MSVGKKVLPFKMANFIGLFNFEWHGQNEVGSIAILVVWGDCQKPYYNNGVRYEISFPLLLTFSYQALSGYDYALYIGAVIA